MPIYEYQCTACGHTLDALQKMSDEALIDCPACQKAALQKIMSATSFQLKGTGWYVTDFRNKNQAEPTKEAASVTSSPEAGAVTSNSAASSTTTDATGA